MVQSINTKVDLTADATSYLGFTSYGKVIVGNNGFEYFNEKNPKDYIQIPWNEIDYVLAEVLFKGKWIPRFAIQTKRSGTFSFSAKDPKKVLRGIRNYVEPDRLVQSLGVIEKIRRGLRKK